jgi:ribosomal-protein-alanine N-acetyltransferase
MSVLTRAVMADAAGLAAIHAAAFPPGEAWTEADIAGLLAMPGCLALWVPGAACIMLRLVLDEAEILTLATHPDCRRRGHAQSLLAAAIEACRSNAVTALFLEVGVRNHAAGALYAGAGFLAIASRPKYYADGGDAVVMKLRPSEG